MFNCLLERRPVHGGKWLIVNVTVVRYESLAVDFDYPARNVIDTIIPCVNLLSAFLRVGLLYKFGSLEIIFQIL